MLTKEETKFKETEIGLIPEEWKVKELGDIIEFNPYRSLKKGTICNFVTMADLNPFQRQIAKSCIKEFSGGSKFRNGDTLLARITPCLENGKTAFVDILKNNIVAGGSTEFMVLAPCDSKVIDNTFIYYLFTSKVIRDMAIKSMVGSSGRQRVQEDMLAGYKISLPPLHEQKSIAEILSSLDEKIELNRRMNKTLEEMGKALFKRWFVDFEFPDENGKPYKSSGGKMVDSELGEIPEGWKVDLLGNLINRLESGKRPKGGVDSSLKVGIPSIGAENINGLGFYDYSKTKFVDRDFYDKSLKGRVHDYDTLLYKDGASLGRKTLFGKGFPFSEFMVNEHVFILTGSEEISSFFLYFWLDQPTVTQDIINLNANSAQPGLNMESVKSLNILKPYQVVVNQFNQFAKPIIDLILKNSIESHL
ncbi:MAG: hypothetical protein RLZZ361_420, partial [Cyanobacteriota bacterium]